MLLLGNATNDWMKSGYFLPALYLKSAKLFIQKKKSVTHTLISSLCCMKRTHLFEQVAIVCCANWIASSINFAWQNFLENNFADFLDEVLVKIIQISSSRWWCFITALSEIDVLCENWENWNKIWYFCLLKWIYAI